MLKGAWILPAMMVAALVLAAVFPAELFAAERNSIDWSKSTAQPSTAFKNLPGVIPEAERVQKSEYTCTSDIQDVYRSRGNYSILYGDRVPTRVYNCTTESGVTYTGTRMPVSPNWVPGLNPLHLPR